MIDLTDKVCEAQIKHSNSWGKWKKKCEKPAANTDPQGRLLCVSCGRKHNKKLQKVIDNNRKNKSPI